ncbi:MAG: aldolase/citrate lyase family protein [Vicinamibacterales bacterium]
MPISRDVRPRRSFIFAPGTRPDMFPKALASGADIVCVDLEDAVAPVDKAAAREAAFAHLPTAAGPARVERVIRINCLRTLDGMADVQALVRSEGAVDAVLLPKVRGRKSARAVGPAGRLSPRDPAARHRRDQRGARGRARHRPVQPEDRGALLRRR